MIAYPQCPACDSAERTSYMTHNGYELWTCGDCGLIYMDPMPGPDEIAALYSDAYDGASTGYFSKAKSKLRRSWYRALEIRLRVRPANGHRPRLLDIGCNGGFMAESARHLGFNTVGVDLDPISIDYARRNYPDNTYFHGALDDLPDDLIGDGFDAVYTSEVIEHVPDVRGFMRRVSDVTRPKGVFFVTTPDISHWRRPRDVTQWNGLNPPSHCVYFSPANMRRLLDWAGFRVIRRKLNLKPTIKLMARRTS